MQNILHDSLTSVGYSASSVMSTMRREGSSLSVASLPATIMTPKPFFKSKIPTPTKNGSHSGRSTPLSGSRSDLSKLRNLSSPPPILGPKPKLHKVPLRREISSPPSLVERRGSIDSHKSGRGTPTLGGRVQNVSKIPQWRGSSENMNVKGQIRKWESSASLEVRTKCPFFQVIYSWVFKW